MHRPETRPARLCNPYKPLFSKTFFSKEIEVFANAGVLDSSGHLNLQPKLENEEKLAEKDSLSDDGSFVY